MMDKILDLFSRHQLVHLLYSGGKDSTACAELLLRAGFGPRTVLVWVDTGASLPEIRDAVESYHPAFKNLVVIRSDQPGFIKKYGFPTDLAPVDRTVLGRNFCREASGITVCDKYSCCFTNLWKPWTDWALQNGVTALVLGDKQADKYSGANANARWEGRIEICSPIADWSDEQVRSYLRSSGRWQERFAMSHSSIDCWNCTAYWEVAGERLAYLERHHPELSRHVIRLYKAVASESDAKLHQLKTALNGES